MKTALACGFGLMLSLAVCASRPAPSSLVRALPDAADLPGFGHFRAEPRASKVAASMVAFRLEDKLSVTTDVMIFPTEQEAAKWPSQANQKISLKGAGFKPISPVPGSIAAQLLINMNRRDRPFSLMAIDGRSVVQVGIAPGFDSDAKGFAVQRSHGESEVLLARRIAGLCIDRLTALGLTSRPASSASSGAKSRMRG